MNNTEKIVNESQHFAAYGFNEQACYDFFLQSSIFRENFLVTTVEVGQGGPDTRVPVYYWEPNSRLWRGANDVTVAVLYYDWVREVLRNVVRKAASVEEGAPTVGSPLPRSSATRHFTETGADTDLASSPREIVVLPSAAPSGMAARSKALWQYALPSGSLRPGESTTGISGDPSQVNIPVGSPAARCKDAGTRSTLPPPVTPAKAKGARGAEINGAEIDESANLGPAQKSDDFLSDAKKFLDKFSKFDSSKYHAAKYILSKVGEEHFVNVAMNSTRRDLLPVQGGLCIDLRTGSPMERLREHYFSMTCGLSAFLGTGVGGGPSQPRDSASLGTEGSGVGNLPELRLEDPCPFVELMMHRLFGGDRELIDWIQRLFGLYLSGEKYSKMVCLYGGGGNGKSVLSRLLGKVLGGMSHLDCPKALLFDVADKEGRSGDFSHRQDMLTRAANDLESKRLLVCDEVGKGLCLNEEKFKQITGGGDTMSARKLYHESRTIDTSSAKILTLANPPFFEVPSSSFAFKRRMAVVEVKARFSHDSCEVDHLNVFPALEPRVLDELLDRHTNEFLRWCVIGSRRFYKFGMDDEPEAVRKSTENFFSEQDPVVQFFDQAPLEYTGLPIDGVSLKDLAYIWFQEGFGSITTRSLGKLLRSRTDKYMYRGEYVPSATKDKSRGVRGWRKS